VRRVVLAHQARDVGQRHLADTLLHAAPLPVTVGEAAQEREVRLPRGAERREPAGQRLLAVAPLLREARAVEVGQEGPLLAEQPADAHAEPFRLEVRQVPALLDRRERRVGPGPPRVLRIQRAQAVGHVVRHGREVVEHCGVRSGHGAPSGQAGVRSSNPRRQDSARGRRHDFPLGRRSSGRARISSFGRSFTATRSGSVPGGKQVVSLQTWYSIVPESTTGSQRSGDWSRSCSQPTGTSFMTTSCSARTRPTYTGTVSCRGWNRYGCGSGKTAGGTRSTRGCGSRRTASGRYVCAPGAYACRPGLMSKSRTIVKRWPGPTTSLLAAVRTLKYGVSCAAPSVGGAPAVARMLAPVRRYTIDSSWCFAVITPAASVTNVVANAWPAGWRRPKRSITSDCGSLSRGNVTPRRAANSR